MAKVPFAVVILNLFQDPVGSRISVRGRMAAALVPILAAAALSSPGIAQASSPAPTVPNPACMPPPAVETGPLDRHKQAADQTLKNFDTAYRQACSKGVLRDRTLVKAGSVPGGRLFLKNAPDANVASIYNEGGEGERPGRMVLEYPFVTDDGVVHIPTAWELEEAIFCSVHGATAVEQEEEGRCLPD